MRLCWLVVLVVPPPVLLLLLELLDEDEDEDRGAAIDADGGADFFGLGMNSCWPMLSLFGSLILLASTMSDVFTSTSLQCRPASESSRPCMIPTSRPKLPNAAGCAEVAAAVLEVEEALLLVVGAVALAAVDDVDRPALSIFSVVPDGTSAAAAVGAGAGFLQP